MINKKKKTDSLRDFAGIEYMGLAGVTFECVRAISKLIHFGDKIHTARLVSSLEGETRSHGFILTINHGEQVGIKSGFASGYTGTGAVGFSIALRMLSKHGAEIEEYDVEEGFIERLNKSCLLQSDLDFLDEARYIRPYRYPDYIIDRGDIDGVNNYDKIKSQFPSAIPFSLIDNRLIDLAINFPDNSDFAITSAFKRLEDIVRERTGLNESSSKLFSKAFQGDTSLLYWDDKDKGEHGAKASMFTSIFGAYRNPRSHRELISDKNKLLREFLLINELYLLEGAAVERVDVVDKNVA